MKKVKISFAALALVLTIGATVSANVKAKFANDCSSVIGGPLDRESSKCLGIDEFCCSNATMNFRGPYAP